MHRDYRGRSGPYSIHDARQHAWSRLVFGPGAPAPNQRPHRGMLPDVFFPDDAPPPRPSLLRRLMRLFGRKDESQTPDGAEEGLGQAPSPAPPGKAGRDRLAA